MRHALPGNEDLGGLDGRSGRASRWNTSKKTAALGGGADCKRRVKRGAAAAAAQRSNSPRSRPPNPSLLREDGCVAAVVLALPL